MTPAARPELLKISPDGLLREDDRYRLRIVTDSEESIIDISVVVDGDEVARGVLGNPASYRGDDGALLHVYTPTMLGPSETDSQILLLIYGFARIEVTLRLSNGARVDLESDDIPVLVRGDRETEMARIEGMFDALFSAPPSRPLQWMLTGTPSQEERFSIVEGGVTNPATRSVSTFLQVTEQVLSEFELLLPSFRGHVRSSISEVPTRVPGGKVRVASSREAYWVASHPDVLQRTRIESGIRLGSGYYMPRYVQTGQRARSFDTYENRAIVSFLSACSQRLGRLSALIEAERGISRSVERALNPFSVDGYILSSLLIAATGSRRGEAIRERSESLRRKAAALEHAYKLAAPEVEPERFLPPRRSKVFQEVVPYTKVYELITRWCTMGDLDMRGSLLALRTARMDRFYEYYVLLSILTRLDKYGFKPSDSIGTPIEVVEYSLAVASRYYRNEKQVANKYVLEGGTGTVTLYYQPVIYGDEREENGIRLHRTSVAAEGHDSYYTPDFLLVFESASGIKTVMIDAKYRYTRGVMQGSQEGEFQKCLRKYHHEVSGIIGPPDAVWLLCGRGAEVETRYWEQSTWARTAEGFIRSGATTLTPIGDDLDALFEMIGVLQGQIDDRPAIGGERFDDDAAKPNAEVESAPSLAYVVEALNGSGPQGSASPASSDEEEQSGPVSPDSLDGKANDVTAGETVLTRAIPEAPEEGVNGLEEESHRVVHPIQSEADAKDDGASSARKEVRPRRKGASAPKKKSASGNGNRARHDSSAKADELVRQIYGLLGRDRHLLFEDGWSRLNIGMGRPVLRDSKPLGKEASRYVPFDIDGSSLFLARDWTPLNINKAVMLMRHLSK